MSHIQGMMGFPGSSASKESACNAVDPGSIPRLGRSPGEEIGYPLHYSWASLVAQLVKNPPAMWETWVQSLCWEDPLEEGMATHSSILAWRIPLDRGAWWPTVHGDMTEQLSTQQSYILRLERDIFMTTAGPDMQATQIIFRIFTFTLKETESCLMILNTTGTGPHV